MQCPGRYFALDAVFINVASVLHVFNILAVNGEHHEGRKRGDRRSDAVRLTATWFESRSLLTYHAGGIRYPADCRYTIKARSKEAEVLVREHVMSMKGF